MSHKWRRPGHITLLETIAVLDLLKRRVRKLECHRSKILVLVDNQAVIGILTKGRSSARQLQSPLRRIAHSFLMVIAASFWPGSSQSGILQMARRDGSPNAHPEMPKRHQVLQKASKEERRPRFLAFLIAHRKPYPHTFLRIK